MFCQLSNFSDVLLWLMCLLTASYTIGSYGGIIGIGDFGWSYT